MQACYIRVFCLNLLPEQGDGISGRECCTVVVWVGVFGSIWFEEKELYKKCSSLAEESFQLLFHIISVLEARSCQEVQYCMDNQSCFH